MSAQMTFFILTGIAILSSVLMISRIKTVYAAFYFVLTLLAVSGIFLQLKSRLLLASEWIAIVCVIAGLIVLAVELGKIDLALFAEYPRNSWLAAALVSFALLVQIGLVVLQKSLLPGEKLTELTPSAPLPWALSFRELFDALFQTYALPLGLLLCIAFAASLGFGALFRKRAE
jgi:NADH:ubiquinone oxidoreductase subunit 6 (subunit J)